MGRHIFRLQIEFNIEDEVALTAASELLEAGAVAPEYSGFENALAHEAIMISQRAWENAGLKVVGIGVWL